MSFADPDFEVEAVITSALTGKSSTFTNIHNFTIIKSPFNKSANITMITIEADYAFLSLIANETKSKYEPACKIKIYNLDKAASQKDVTRGKRGTILYSNNFFVYASIDEQSLSEMNRDKQLSDQSRIMTFVLANPILYWLQTNHEHITLSDSITADGALKKYENYLSSEFGSDAFSFQHLAKDINPHIYEQIFSKSTCDLETPSRLISEYKAYDSLTYYFYDDFSISALAGNNASTSSSGSNKKAINNITLSLGSILQLPKVDMLDSNHKDAVSHVSVDSTEAGTDMFLEFQKNAATIAIESSDGHIETILPTAIGDKRPVVNGGSVKSHDKVVSAGGVGRSVHGKDVSMADSKIIPQHHVTMYGPDNARNARIRFLNTQKLITSEIKSYTDMTFQQCYPDLINLTSMYNLDTTARSRFAFLPIAISNIFHKQKSQSARLTHSIKAKFIEFNI